MQKKIVVIAGGRSKEREISLRSGQGCFKALEKLGYQAYFLDLTDLEKIEELIKLKKEEAVNCALVCLHGEYGEDGRIQGLLDWLEIKYPGSGVLASALCLDKFYTRLILEKSNLKIPAGGILDFRIKINNFPVIIKERSGGSSIGVYKINSLKEFEEFLQDPKNKQEISEEKYLWEEFITGKEVTVSVLEKNRKRFKTLPILELKPKKEFYDFEAKYTEDLTEFILPARLNDRQTECIQKISQEAFRALNCSGFARVDLMIKENPQEALGIEPFILEVNTIPGMTELSDLPAQAKHQNISYEKLVQLIVESCF